MMKRRRVSSGLICVILVFGSFLKAAENLVQNPGFELRGDDAGGLAVWPLPGGAGVHYARDSEISRSGKASGRIDGLDADKQSRFVQAWRQDIVIEPSTRYWLSVWVRAEELTRGRIGVLHRNKQGEVLLNQVVASFSGSFDWREFGGELKQVEGATHVQLVIGIQKSTGTAWFDDIGLIEYAGTDREFGTWEFHTPGALPAGGTAPVQAVFDLGNRGLQRGGSVRLQWLNWRPAREFRLDEFNVTSSVNGATFEISVPPKKTSWPPIRQPLAVIVTLTHPSVLPAGTRVTLAALLRASPHSNVISPLRGLLTPGPEQSARPLNGTVDVKSTGGPAAEIRCYAEMRPVEGRSGRVTVALTDEHGNPATGFRGTVKLSCPGSDLPDNYTFTDQDAGSHTFQATVAAGRVSRIQAAWNGRRAISNPVLPRSPEAPGLYFGDIHTHCEVSGDGVGDPDLAYIYARHFHGLDFACLSDHSPVGARWERIMAVNNRHNAPGHFVALLGYEWSDGRHGHRNAYFPVARAPSVPQGLKNNTSEWWELLDRQGIDALTVPHHTNTQAAQIRENGEPAWGPCDWSTVNHTYQRIVEICQNRGSFEVPGGPDPELRVMRKDVGSSVQIALAKGHRLGFIGSTDTHTGRPGTGPARCVVITHDLSRRGVWDALYDRRCYATTGPHTFLSFTVNGSGMGSEIRLKTASEDRTCSWRVVGTGPLKRVDLLRNNDVIESWDGKQRDDLEGTFSFGRPCVETEWWYVRALQEDTHIAWSSPVWIDPPRTR